MELLYVWIEEYNNIKRQGFNFSPKHHFHFEPNEKEGPVTGGTLTHNDINPSYPDNFFGEHISNITAIVGKNGSGKSSLIDFITTRGGWAFEERTSSSGYIFITKENTKNLILHYFCSHAIKDSLFSQHGEKLITENVLDAFYKTQKEETSDYKHNILYYSSALNSNEKLAASKSYTANISTNFLLETAGHPKEFELTRSENLKKTNPSLTAFRFHDKKKQIELLSHFSKNDKLTPFKCPETFSIQLLFSFEESYINKLNKVRDLEYLLLTGSSKESLQNENIEKYLYFTLLASTNYKEKKYDSFSELKNILEKEFNINNDFSYYSTMLSKCSSSSISETRSPSLDGAKRLLIFELSFKFNFPRFDNDLLSFLEDKNQTLALKKWAYHIRPLISWDDISDGETSLISIFARIWHEHKNRNNGFTTCIFDEPDTSLHPEWQQSLVDRFKNFFSLLGEKKKYHLIITSHSPIVISDLPRENIIFLDKNASGECVVKEPKDMDRTFGANIHSLYRSSFFMNGLMGKFAEGKIEKVLKDLRGDGEIEEKRKTEIRFIIGQVGEPLVREMLLKQYNQKFHFNIEDRIEVLEKELEALKARRDDTN